MMNNLVLTTIFILSTVIGTAQQYCASSPNSNSAFTSQASSIIAEVVLMGDGSNIINNTAGVADFYEDYTSAFSADLTEGLSYSVDVTFGSMGSAGASSNYAGGKVFIDFNIDGDFNDVGEDIGIIPYGENSSASISFTVPNTGVYGTSRMRVVAQYRGDQNSNNIGPCDVGNPNTFSEPWFGATEDYSIVLNTAAGCNKSIVQSVSNFSPNPLYGYMQFSYDTLSLTSTASCDINIRPEFIISHQDSAIEIGDFTIEWHNGTFFSSLPYSIDLNGNAVGFWNLSATDSTGYNLVTGSPPQQMVIRVRFMNPNNNPNTTPTPYGTYTAAWTTFEVDNIGNKIQALAPTDSVSISLVNCNLFAINNESSSSISCFGANDGYAAINNISNGSGSYSYLWSNGEITQTIQNLEAGNYTCTVTDNNWPSCSAISSTITISEPALVTTGLATSDISCFGLSDGSAQVSPTGVTGLNYAVSWNGGAPSNLNIIPLQAGTYSVAVENTITGCSSGIELFTITEPAEITSSYTQTNVTCFGADDGTAIVNFFGGTAGNTTGDTNYILEWDSLIYILPFPNSTFITPIGVPAGVYPFSATDLNGCPVYDTIIITQADSLYTAYTLTNYDGYNVSCNGNNDATIDVQINGGSSPFLHYFNDNLINSNPIENISAGVFTDSIVDANGCIYSYNLTITEPSALNATLTSNNVSCINYCDAEIQTSVNGGIPPYNYSWNTNNLDSLCSGLYTLLITDANGCDTNLSIFITEPNIISFTIDTANDISIYGGSNGLINISPFGGNGNLSVSWTGPNGFSSNNEDINSLIAGTYYFTIIDNNSCLITDSITLSQPSSLSSSILIESEISCNGQCDGAINITADGGDSVYYYLWTGPNGYTSTNEDINGLCSGTYYLELSDTSSTIYDTITINEPLSLFSLLNTDTITCYNSSCFAEILVYGGTSPFEYNWSNGATNYFTDLYAGSHTVEVTDLNGCVLLETIILDNPDAISLQASISDVSCYGAQDASLEINVNSGGTPPYLYSNNNGINNQMLNSFFNIGAGNYNYLVTDDNGCTNEINLTINQPDSFYSSFLINNTSCYEQCDGSIDITVNGGSPLYTYQWSGPNGYTSSNEDLNGLCSGNYNITIIDSNGCLTTEGVYITEPNPIIINILQNGANIEATTGFINYQWYDGSGNPIQGATTNILTPTIQGEYYVQVTDSNGCSTNSYSILFIIEVIDFINEGDLSVNIYPNPTNGKILIECTKEFNTISVCNTFGNTLYKLKDSEAYNKKIVVDLSPFSKGLYFLKIEANDQLIIQKIILQ